MGGVGKREARSREEDGTRTSRCEALVDLQSSRELLKVVSRAVSQSVLWKDQHSLERSIGFGKINTDNGLEGWSMRERERERRSGKWLRRNRCGISKKRWWLQPR